MPTIYGVYVGVCLCVCRAVWLSARDWSKPADKATVRGQMGRAIADSYRLIVYITVMLALTVIRTEPGARGRKI